jgi:hypothetical protein
MWGQSTSSGILLSAQGIDKANQRINYSLTDTTGTNLASYAEVIYLMTGTPMGWNEPTYWEPTN